MGYAIGNNGNARPAIKKRLGFGARRVLPCLAGGKGCSTNGGRRNIVKVSPLAGPEAFGFCSPVLYRPDVFLKRQFRRYGTE